MAGGGGVVVWGATIGFPLDFNVTHRFALCADVCSLISEVRNIIHTMGFMSPSEPLSVIYAKCALFLMRYVLVQSAGLLCSDRNFYSFLRMKQSSSD